jgi:hypothetical protein
MVLCSTLYLRDFMTKSPKLIFYHFNI